MNVPMNQDLNQNMNQDMKIALELFKKGEFVIVTDDEGRENEGDLFLLASEATAEKLAFMVRHTSGVICVPMTESRSRQLHLPLMVKNNQDNKRTAFTVTVDAKHGITTGISAAERALTIKALGDLTTTAEDFVRPGHIFPLISNENGLRARQGHTEAAVEMCRLVRETEVGVISELVNEDGSMMRGDELQNFSKAHNIPIVTIAELLKLLDANENQTKDLVSNSNLQNDLRSNLPSKLQSKFHWAKLPRFSKGNQAAMTWQIATFSGRAGVDHAVMKLGDPSSKPAALVRIHSECLTGDVLGSLRCDCGSQLSAAMEKIESQGAGIVIYLRDQEGRGIGISEKIRAYELQDQGLDTVEANLALGHDVDVRDFSDAVEVLHALGITTVNLLTNNPEKLQTLIDSGINAQAHTLHGEINEFNSDYIKTKRDRLGHR